MRTDKRVVGIGAIVFAPIMMSAYLPWFLVPDEKGERIAFDLDGEAGGLAGRLDCLKSEERCG